eukprot:191443-Chlamydomonas_euryale.AAC.5
MSKMHALLTCIAPNTVFWLSLRKRVETAFWQNSETGVFQGWPASSGPANTHCRRPELSGRLALPVQYLSVVCKQCAGAIRQWRNVK